MKGPGPGVTPAVTSLAGCHFTSRSDAEGASVACGRSVTGTQWAREPSGACRSVRASLPVSARQGGRASTGRKPESSNVKVNRPRGPGLRLAGLRVTGRLGAGAHPRF
jgi:hypothetical protein